MCCEAGGSGRTCSGCSVCRAFDEGIERRRHDLAAMAPAMPAAAAASVLQGLGGGAGQAAGGGGGMLGTLGGGAGKGFAGTAAFKAAALAAVTVGAGAGALKGIPAVTGGHGGVPPARVAPVLRPSGLPAGPGGAAATAIWHSSGLSTAQSRTRSGVAASGAGPPQHSPSAAPSRPRAGAARNRPALPPARERPRERRDPPGQAHNGPSSTCHGGPGPAAASHAGGHPAPSPQAGSHPAPTAPFMSTRRMPRGSHSPAAAATGCGADRLRRARAGAANGSGRRIPR